MNLKKNPLYKSKFSILQHRITQATYKKQPRKIRNLQRLLIKSLSTRIQIILIASQIKDRPSFFLYTGKKKSKNFERKKQKQKKYLYSMNSYFVNKFSLIFYKKFFYYFVFFSFFFLKKKKKEKAFYLEKKKHKNKKKIKEIPSSRLFLLLCYLVFSPVIETLIQEKKEKIFRSSSELILFLKNFSDSNIEFVENPSLARIIFFKDQENEYLKEKASKEATSSQLSQNFTLDTKRIDKRTKNFTWILKLEIKGFYDHSNNSWLYRNFPIESMNLKQFLKLMLHFYFLFIRKEEKKKLKQKIKGSFMQNKSKEQNYFKKNLKKKAQLFNKDFFNIWNNLSSKKNFFDNFFYYPLGKENFDNFFCFCLIGLENYLKEIFYTFNEFYFSEWYSQSLFENESMTTSKQIKHIFYFPRFIYLTGINPRQFKKIQKFINLFLKRRGLYLNDFTYFNLKKGVHILGWHLKTEKKNLIVKVSESFCNFQKKEIKWLIKNSNHEPINKLIIKLNNKIKNDLLEYEKQRLYNILNFQHMETLYNDLNFFINKIFWKWAKKKHNNRSNIWIFQKYWSLRKIPISFFFLKEKKRRIKKFSSINSSSTQRSLFFQRKNMQSFVFFHWKKMKKKKNKKLQKEIITNKKRIFVLLYSNESWKKLYDNFFFQNKNLLKTKHPAKKVKIEAQANKFELRKDPLDIFFFIMKKKNENHLFNKYKKNLYFLNFYSLDFQTQYSFYTYSLLFF